MYHSFVIHLSSNSCNQKIVVHLIKELSYFYFPLPVREPLKELDPWNKSALDAVENNQNKWIRLRSSKKSNQYQLIVDENTLPPDWSEEDANYFLNKAFKDKIVDSIKHPIIKELLGE